jgi:hypothetical protein
VTLADVFLPQPAGGHGRRALQLNSRYRPDERSVLINGQRQVLTTAERLVVDRIASRPGSTRDDVVAALAERQVDDAAGVLAGLLRRDIISHLVD